MPGKQLVNAVDRVLGNAFEHMAQVQVRIPAIEQGGADQAVDVGRPLPAAVRPGEEVVTPA